MSVDESISGVNSSFGLPITGHGPSSLIKRITAKFIWPFLRHQVDLNHVLVAEIRELQARQAVLSAVVEHQLSPTGQTTVTLGHLGSQLEFIEDGLHNVENALHILEGQYTSVVMQRESHLADVQTHLTTRTQQLENQIDLSHRQLLARFYDGFGALQRDVTDIVSQFADLATLVGEYEARTHVELDVERRQIAGALARMAEVDHFLTEVKRSYPELAKPEQLVKLSTGFDAVSRAHALRFRGSFDEVKERVSIYLPELKSIAALGPVLDVGCGGGELLTVLKENDLDAYGIEILGSAVDECVAAGLDARVDDALHHLAAVPKASLGAVTAIHVVEHLGMDTLIEMIDLALQALKPGGMIIFETPNPGNVMVGADSFYIDPTHDHPIPSALLEFLVSIRGFTDAHVVPLKRAPNLFTNVMPTEGVWANDVSRVAQHVANVFLGAEDYAVVARRAV
ncbi:MAG: methyltransferase domain-containing protein [Acidimicrobiaceae bacterium]|nr:methyltransferase domain-containing protein [Acidimicrobiaceae bacterium]